MQEAIDDLDSYYHAQHAGYLQRSAQRLREVEAELENVLLAIACGDRERGHSLTDAEIAALARARAVFSGRRGASE